MPGAPNDTHSRGWNADDTAVLGIYVGHVDRYSRFYTINGQWATRRPRTINFVVANFLSPQVASPLRAALPENLASAKSQVDSGALAALKGRALPVIDKMAEFLKQSEACYRRHSAALDHAHAKLAHEEDVRFLKLTEIADKVFGKDLPAEQRSPADMYALHSAITRPDVGILPDSHNHRLSSLFEIRSKREMYLFRMVEHWFRSYHHSLVFRAENQSKLAKELDQPEKDFASHMRHFLEVARDLVTMSRRTRVPSEGPILLSKFDNHLDPQRPVKAIKTGVTFTETDLVIISFLRAWAAKGQISTSTPTSSLGSRILRATGMYEGHPLTRATGFMFLQEIGAYTPWENRHALIERLQLAELEWIRQHRDHSHLDSRSSQFEDLTDSMRDVRKDWGDLDVYCIDNEGTLHTEDGISVEGVPGTEQKTWVHIHIAHPTAFIPPSHPLAIQAQRQGQSVYMSDAMWPLLPAELMKSRFIMAPNREVLTFSTLLDADGVTLDIRVTAGIVRKVHFVTARSISSLLHDEQSINDYRTIWVGKRPGRLGRQNVQTIGDLEDRQVEDLKVIAHLTGLRWKLRKQPQRVSYTISALKMLVYLGEAEKEVRAHDGRQARLWEGDPFLRGRVLRWDAIQPAANSTVRPPAVVNEMMIMASETAGRWCHQRGIPVPYRGTIGHNPEAKPDDPVNHTVFYHYASHAIPHDVLGVSMYAKTTSPLRRYGDMITHWQIDAVLRREAAHLGSDEQHSSGTEGLPFSVSDVDGHLQAIRDRARLCGSLEKVSRIYWMCQLLTRARHVQMSWLPSKFTCFITESNQVRRRMSGFLKELHVPVSVIPIDGIASATTVKPNDEFEVEIHRIDTYGSQIYVRPLRLSCRAEDQPPLELWRIKQVTV